jgi:RIO kinase 2
MARHEFVPRDFVASYATVDRGLIEKHLPKLAQARLIRHHPPGPLPYDGFDLTYAGYDCLALNALVKRDTVSAIGKPLGLGKESDVYDALSARKRRLALKFQRLGRISFRQTKRVRGFVAQRSHISWLYQSRLAAEREFEALRRLWQAGVAVPKPLAHNRHVIAMGYFNGLELSKFPKLSRPRRVFRDLLKNVKAAHQKAGIVHGDLSEYNVLVNLSERILLIDWPQFVYKNHPTAKRLLTRDIKNIEFTFRTRFGQQSDPDAMIEYVTGARASLAL